MTVTDPVSAAPQLHVDLYTYAEELRQLGFTALPLHADGSKRPLVHAWTHLQHDLISAGHLQQIWRDVDTDGIGVLCGAASGGLQMVECEGRALHLATQLSELMTDNGLAEVWHRVSTGWVEGTPSGGIHWHYRCPEAGGNTKIARRTSPDGKTVEVLLETRGQGGFTVAAPSAGRTHPTGRGWTRFAGGPHTCPTLTLAEHEKLLAVASMLDEMPAAPPPAPKPQTRPIDGTLRPGDDYTARTSWAEILTPHGWQLVRSTGDGRATWTRPGKNTRDGISATTREDAGLYVFSTSTGFDTEVPYSKFGAYALLEHGGDMSAAARALRAAGYGEQQANLTQLLTREDTPCTPKTGSATAQDAGLAPGTSRDAHAISTGTNSQSDASTQAPPEINEDAFWDAKASLTHIREYALARMCAPWAVFGNVLARVAYHVPPYVVLPPTIGGVASLNLIIASVAPSGGGKGAAEGAADGAFIWPGDAERFPVSSGEGIAHAYVDRVKNEETGKWEPQQVRDAIMWTIGEVDQLTALTSGRRGSTLEPALRALYSGEMLGSTTADRDRRVRLLPHRYRATLTIGVQPGRAGTLLGDASMTGGTLQRLLWLPATSTEVTADPHPAPARPTLVMPHLWTPREVSGDGYYLIPIPAEVAEYTRAIHVANQRGERAAADGHANLTRLKVAFLLAVLDGRKEMRQDDWALSEVVMAVSDRTRSAIERELSAARMEEVERAGRVEGLRQVVVSETVERHSIARISRRILSALSAAGGEMTWGDLRKVTAYRDRGCFEEAVEVLSGAGQVEVHETHGQRSGRRVRLP